MTITVLKAMTILAATLVAGMVVVRRGQTAQNYLYRLLRRCQRCHVPAKATDWIYVNGYPGRMRRRSPLAAVP
jgi:hypothetical protein